MHRYISQIEIDQKHLNYEEADGPAVALLNSL